MSTNAFAKLLATDGYIQVNKYLIKKLGLHEAILIGELCSEYNYWESQNKLIDDMFYSTRENIEQNTGLNAHFQRKALTTLVNAGIVEIHKQGLPATNHYKINFDRLLTCLTSSSTGGEALEVKEVNINNNNINKITNNNSFSKLNEEDKSSNPSYNVLKTNNDNINSTHCLIEEIDNNVSTVKDLTNSTEIQNKETNKNLNKEITESNYDERLHYKLPTGKIVKKTTKSPKLIKIYIDNLKYIKNMEVNGKFIATLTTWYYAVGIGIVSIDQLEKKLIYITEQCNNDLTKVTDAIHIAYINGWKAFYVPNVNKTYNKKSQAAIEVEQGVHACDFLKEHGRHFDADLDAARDNNGNMITF